MANIRSATAVPPDEEPETASEPETATKTETRRAVTAPSQKTKRRWTRPRRR